MGRINNFPMTIEIADALSKKFAMVGKGQDPNSREIEISVYGKIRKKKIGHSLKNEYPAPGKWMLSETNMITPDSEKR